MPKQLIPIRLDLETVKELDKIVADSVGERSDHLRKAIDEYIARYRSPVSNDAPAPTPASD